jgi:hypothetical protein
MTLKDIATFRFQGLSSYLYEPQSGTRAGRLRPWLACLVCQIIIRVMDMY